MFNDDRASGTNVGVKGLTHFGPIGIVSMSDRGFGVDTVRVSRDTLGFEAGKAKYVSEQPQKSTTLAMLLSMALPGAGQVYVHRYITIPLIWGFGYYFFQSWQHQNSMYHQYRDAYTRSLEQDTTAHQGDVNLKSVRDLFRDDRDRFAFYMAITYILNIVDAYVGASLYSFDVSDNLGGSAAIRLRIPIR